MIIKLSKKKKKKKKKIIKLLKKKKKKKKKNIKTKSIHISTHPIPVKSMKEN